MHPQSIIGRFWSKVDTTGDCWDWTAGCDRDGYGRFRLGRQKARAHRVAWELTYGPIPEGLCVLHHCDRPVCVRPSHLFLGTNTDNTQDRDMKGRTARQQGETNGVTKLTPAQVRWAREQYASGVSQHTIARQLGVWQMTISRCVRGECWGHLQ